MISKKYQKRTKIKQFITDSLKLSFLLCLNLLETKIDKLNAPIGYIWGIPALR